MKNWIPMLALALLAACRQQPDQALYRSDAFTVYPDSVVQGKNVARVLSPTHIISNYHSPASETFSRLVKFKFSINEKDNEMPPGQDHWVLIGDEHESPILRFGQAPTSLPTQAPGFLPVNYKYTFRVDLSEVLKQFAKQGYFVTYNGTRIAKADFKGFYIAGGSEPLSWDFVNLGNHGLKLEDPDGDSIYTLTVTLNPYNPSEYQDKDWKLHADLSSRPHYESSQPIVDALFNLSEEEAIKNIEPDSTFRTGAKWGGVWTRDISYSIFLAFAYHEPEVAKISLMKKVKRNRIIQDTGSGGAWPVSSDRTVWSLAAWEIYKTTGDTAWLRKAYEIVKNSLADDDQVIRNQQTGMFQGESSFLDWREQTYPKWMSNKDIYESLNLGTNAVHYQAHIILDAMARELNMPAGNALERANAIRSGMNENLWMPDRGYYGQYLYGRYGYTLSPKAEALGEALSVLFDVASPDQAVSIISKSPVTPFGVTCVYPQTPGIPPYHNNAIWPFVQSYWNLAAAKAGNEEALNFGLAAIYRAGALFLTNYENFVAETGDFLGTEINSDRMLWSMAGNLAMVHRVFMGMHFETGGIRFAPAIPHEYTGKKTLSNFKYRQAVLRISVNGTGNKIKSITLDGKPLKDAFLPASLQGPHTVEIEMDNQPFHGPGLHQVANKFSLPTPQAAIKDGRLTWDSINRAIAYRVYRNGVPVAMSTRTYYPIDSTVFSEYKVSALDSDSFPSFCSEPVWVIPAADQQILQMEKVAPRSSLTYVDYSGSGFVEISNTRNREIKIPVTVDKAGKYLVDFRYSNGSGPWNTDNKCALRSLYANGNYQGAMVFPQRGKDEWSDWGFSNARIVSLQAGSNLLLLKFDDWDINMNVEVNSAMLDYLRLIRLP